MRARELVRLKGWMRRCEQGEVRVPCEGRCIGEHRVNTVKGDEPGLAHLKSKCGSCNARSGGRARNVPMQHRVRRCSPFRERYEVAHFVPLLNDDVSAYVRLRTEGGRGLKGGGGPATLYSICGCWKVRRGGRVRCAPMLHRVRRGSSLRERGEVGLFAPLLNDFVGDHVR